MKIKKISALLITVMLVCSVVMLSACGNDSNVDENGEVTYKVTVKDALGNAYTSGVIVKFMQNGEQAAMQVCDEKGVASKKLKAGEYDVEVSFTSGDNNCYYDKSGLKVTAEKNTLEVNVANKLSDTPAVLSTVDGEFDAYNVNTGCTYVELSKEGRNYYLFTPTEAGTYEFSIADKASVEIGYYGAPFFVQSNNVADVNDNKFILSINEGMLGSGDGGSAVIVIGIDVKDDKTNSCILAVNRTGDPERTIEDEPWTDYKTTSKLSKYELPAGATVEDFDLTASADTYKLVFNTKDGFYHLNSEDGELVVVYLTEDPGYTSCFKSIIDNQRSCKYFFDKDGNLEKKESYNDCLAEYIENADEKTGFYPLTDDLMYIIKQHGDNAGWWDKDSPGYVFIDNNYNKILDINPEISWLFMCGYIAK